MIDTKKVRFNFQKEIVKKISYKSPLLERVESKQTYVELKKK